MCLIRRHSSHLAPKKRSLPDPQCTHSHVAMLSSGLIALLSKSPLPNMGGSSKQHKLKGRDEVPGTRRPSASLEECRCLPRGAWPSLCVKCGLASHSPPEENETTWRENHPHKQQFHVSFPYTWSWFGKGMQTFFEIGLLCWRPLGILHKPHCPMMICWLDIISFLWNPALF